MLQAGQAIATAALNTAAAAASAFASAAGTDEKQKASRPALTDASVIAWRAVVPISGAGGAAAAAAAAASSSKSTTLKRKASAVLTETEAQINALDS
jgi:hypothetical protein